MNHARSLGSAILTTLAIAWACGTRGDLSLGWLDEPRRSDAGYTSHSGGSSTATSTDDESNTAVDISDEDVAELDAGGQVNMLPTSGLDAAMPASSSSPPTASPCNAAIALPIERFDFSGEGTQIVDRMGGPSGELIGGASLTGAGSIELDGEDDYVNLPNGLLSSKTSASLVVWVSLLDGPAYWRLLDFGASSGGEDPTGAAVGTTYVAITTETGLDPSGLALLIGHGGAASEDRALTELSLEDRQVALGVVLDGESERAILYVDGASVASTTMTAPLSELNDVNNWLGRSQYAADPHYPGIYSELRLYAEALSDCAMATLAEWGPDTIL